MEDGSCVGPVPVWAQHAILALIGVAAILARKVRSRR